MLAQGCDSATPQQNLALQHQRSSHTLIQACEALNRIDGARSRCQADGSGIWWSKKTNSGFCGVYALCAGGLPLCSWVVSYSQEASKMHLCASISKPLSCANTVAMAMWHCGVVGTLWSGQHSPGSSSRRNGVLLLREVGWDDSCVCFAVLLWWCVVVMM